MSMVRFRILAGKNDYDAAYRIATAYSDAHPDDAMVQNEIAWAIVSQTDLAKRDLNLAAKAAERANKAAKGNDPNILDTLARVQFMSGKEKEAVATQQRAVEIAEGRMKANLEKTLASYKEGKLPAAQ
jgi:hypothetical protein